LSVYPPSEDTFLLLEALPRSLVGKRVIEVGTGSAFIAREAKLRGASEVLATDLSEKASLAAAKSGIDALACDLLSCLNPHAKFDLILFNPPYLPAGEEDSPMWTGGRGGWEITYKFVLTAISHLRPHGSILFVSSSVSAQALLSALSRRGVPAEKMLEKQFFFEALYVYRAKCPLGAPSPASHRIRPPIPYRKSRNARVIRRMTNLAL